MTSYKISHERYRKQHDAKIQLKDRMIESLDRTTLDLVIPDLADYNTITFHELYLRIKDPWIRIYTPALTNYSDATGTLLDTGIHFLVTYNFDANYI